MGYILVEDIFDEMSQNITYIKLNSYLKRKIILSLSFCYELVYNYRYRGRC